MKTFLIVFFVPVFLYGQAVWTPPVIIEDITVNAADKIISYSDANGNHVVINSSGTITYYRLNIEGSLETNVAIDNSCEYSNYTVAITAYQDELYIAYQKGIYIKVVKSINGGNSWANLTETNMDNNICNGIDAVYDEKGLHVVWAIKRQSDDFFETWYERYKRTEPQQWEARYNITDEAFADIGGRPTIALSENRIHVNYNIYSGYELNGPYYYNLGYIDAARTRDFNFTPNTWESSQLVFISEPSLPFPCEVDFWSSSAEKIIVHNGYLHFISFVWVFPVLGTCGIPWFFIYDKRRPIDNPNWESETVISQYCGADQNMPVVAITGQKLHTMAFFPRISSCSFSVLKQ
jgi:hypothetical protein